MQNYGIIRGIIKGVQSLKFKVCCAQMLCIIYHKGTKATKKDSSVINNSVYLNNNHSFDSSSRVRPGMTKQKKNCTPKQTQQIPRFVYWYKLVFSRFVIRTPRSATLLPPVAAASTNRLQWQHPAIFHVLKIPFPPDCIPGRIINEKD
ncbi:MAG: hypothetical protein JWP12_2723 [Bacteroidetes bacterium]|nr:hypothetical protein [Bacteroidota bacterium]